MKKKTNLKNSNKNNGLTIVEVLVSVLITCIVVVYGVSFFAASWRLSTESTDYNIVLNDLIRNAEIIKGYNYNSLDSLPALFPVLREKKLLRTGVEVQYTYDVWTNNRTINGKPSSFFGSKEILITARWPIAYESSSDKAKSMERLNFKFFRTNAWLK